MTGKLLDSGSPGALVFILPIALAIILLLNFWPIIFLLMFLSLLWKLWQNYQWNQWCIQVNPYFNGLIKENQGRLTSIDLSLKANLAPLAAQRFLEKKAAEFGAQRQIYEDKSIVYYFLTASALGQIFEDSEPEEISDPKKTPQLTSASSAVELEYHESSVSEIAQLTENPPAVERETKSNLDSEVGELETENHKLSSSSVSEQPQETNFSETSENGQEENTSSEAISEQPEEITLCNPEVKAEAKPECDLAFNPEELDSENQIQAPVTETSEKNNTHVSLIQAELAKRLDLHASTIGKRKSDADFPQWTQSKDPEGIAWKYSPQDKLFVPLE